MALRLTVKILATLRLTVNIFPPLSPKIFFYGKLFLQLTFEICQFLPLATRFCLAGLRLTVNPTETLYQALGLDLVRI